MLVGAAFLLAATACDRWPSVVVHNDTDMGIIATDVDYEDDSESILAGDGANMALLPEKKPTTYRITALEGEVPGCLTVEFERGQDEAHVRVSEARACET
jgi:hypothetical protein